MRQMTAAREHRKRPYNLLSCNHKEHGAQQSCAPYHYLHKIGIMTKIKFSCLFWIALLTSSMGLAQQAKNFGTPVGANNGQDFTSMQMRESLVNAIINHGRKTTNSTDFSTIDGSRYYDDQFKNGTLFYENELLGSFFMRYNAFQDQMEIKNSNMAEEEHQFLVQSSAIKSVINGKEIQFFSFKGEDGLQGNSYFFREFTGEKYLLYSNKRKKYSPGKASTNSLAQSIPPKFYDEITFFYRLKDDGTLSIIPKNKKEFLTIFPVGKRQNLKKYIRSKKLKTNSLSGLKSIFIYAENL